MAEFGLLAFDANDPETLVRFWSEATGQPVAVASATFAMLAPVGAAPRIVFHAVREGKTAKNRLHLDLRAADRAGEVARLVGLGAVEVATHEQGGRIWTVLQDPEGNELCLAQA